MKFDVTITLKVEGNIQGDQHTDLFLSGWDEAHKIQAIKAVRCIADLSLKAAKDAVEICEADGFNPQLLVEDVTNKALMAARKVAKDYGIKLDIKVRDAL